MIQLVCHHYNPYPNHETSGRSTLKDPKRTDFGPYQFITDKVLTKLNSPMLRLFGVDHVALAWISKDREWTTEKGSAEQQPGQQHRSRCSTGRLRPPAEAGRRRRGRRREPGGAAADGGGMMGAAWPA